VTSENNLYVEATNAVLGVNDTVISLPGVTALAVNGSDLLLGAQGTGNTISLAAATVPVVNTTASNATSGTLTTALDDVITSSASTALVGSSTVSAAIDGGVGSDTLNATLATSGLLTALNASSTTGVALTSIETVNLTVTASTAAVSLTNAIPTTVKTLTVTGTDANPGLTATTTSIGQTIAVTNTTVGGTASTITVADFANATVTTGSANDSVTVNGGASSTGIIVNAGNGADTVTLGAATALTGAGNSFRGDSNVTGTVDTLALNYSLGTSVAVDLDALVTAGTISGFERVTIADSDDSTHAIKWADGITQLQVNSSNSTAEIFNVTATAAQANAITSITDGVAGTGGLNLIISTAGSVSFATDITTYLDTITYQDVAVTLTLNDGAHAVTQGATTPGSSAQSVTFGTMGSSQSADIRSTGTVDFNIAASALNSIAPAFLSDAGTDGTPGLTLTGVTAATVNLNITGAGSTFSLGNDVDISMTRVDTVNVNTTTASTIVAGATGALVMAPTLNLGATTGHIVHLDSIGTQSSAVTITGFAVGTSGDRLLLSQGTDTFVGTGGLTSSKIIADVQSTGVNVGGFTGTTVANAADLLVLSGASFQVSGSLTSTASGGGVATKIIAAGLLSDGVTRFGYFALDNGVDTGVYRVNIDGDVGGSTTVIDTAADVVSIQLIATLVGVADAGTLVAANFG